MKTKKKNYTANFDYFHDSRVIFFAIRIQIHPRSTFFFVLSLNWTNKNVLVTLPPNYILPTKIRIKTVEYIGEYHIGCWWCKFMSNMDSLARSRSKFSMCNSFVMLRAVCRCWTLKQWNLEWIEIWSVDLLCVECRLFCQLE